MRKLICVVTVCFMIITTFSGCGVLQKLGLQKNESEELRPVSSIVMNEDEAKKLTDKVPIHLYFANEDSTKLKLEVRYIPMSEAKKSVNNLASVIVKELIKGPSSDSGLKPTIPAGTQLRSPITINGNVATVDLTKDFVAKHPGGKEAEQLTIYSIVNSLTELKEIQKVKFTVNGKAQKDFKGNFQFDAPFPRSASIISKDVAKPTMSNTNKAEEKKETGDKSKKATPAPQKDTKSTPKPEPTKQGDTKKTNDSSNGTNSGDAEKSSNAAEEDSEATYLEVLE